MITRRVPAGLSTSRPAVKEDRGLGLDGKQSQVPPATEVHPHPSLLCSQALCTYPMRSQGRRHLIEVYAWLACMQLRF